MIHAAQRRAWSKVLYLTNTRPQAKRIIWSVLHEIDSDLKLGAKFNAVELKMKLPNGSEIELGGTNDEFEIERYRGPTYVLVVIDEAQSIRGFMKYLIEEILEPATVDHRGQILLTGTPNAAGIGFFRDVAQQVVKGWSLHSWTILDNPYIPHAREWLDDRRARKGIAGTHETATDPKYRREYRAEWVRDTSSQVYQITDKNLLPRFPGELAEDWEHVLAVDLGFVGVSAFVVLSFSIEANLVVVRESHQVTPSHFGDETLLTPAMLASEIEKMRGRYDFARIVVDPGGLGAKFIGDLRRRWRIPAQAAEKKAKLGAIELLNGDLVDGKVLVVEPTNVDLLHDAALLEWRWDRFSEEDRDRGTVSRSALAIDDRTPDHLTDALTYGYRACRAYLQNSPADAEVPPSGTPAREEWEELERERRELQGSDESEELPWWAQGPGDTMGF